MEDFRELKPFLVTMKCYVKGCGGEMQSEGPAYMTMPAKYVHKCDECGEIGVYYTAYPAVKHMDMEKNDGTFY